MESRGIRRPVGIGEDPISAGVVADCESVCLEMREGEQVCDAVAHKP